MKIHPLPIIVALFLIVGCSPKTEPVKGVYALIEVPSPSLSHALVGAKQTQKVGIYLPPSYSYSTQSYPVVYFLTGFTVSPGEYPPSYWIDSVMENQLVKEMIYVEISGYNVFQGTMYANSPVTGNWEDFVTRDVIHYIDNHYRTIPQRESRGIAGHSMGGGGTFNISLKYPDVYSVAYPMSPAISGDELIMDDLFGNRVTIDTLFSLAKRIKDVKNDDFERSLISMVDTNNEFLMWVLANGYAFAPDLSKPLKMALPFNKTANGEYLRNENWAKWEAGLGNVDEKIKTHKDNLVQYRHYAFDCGYSDENYWLKAGTLTCAKLMAEQNIPFSIHWYNGNHINKVGEQMANRVMPIMSTYLMREEFK